MPYSGIFKFLRRNATIMRTWPLSCNLDYKGLLQKNSAIVSRSHHAILMGLWISGSCKLINTVDKIITSSLMVLSVLKSLLLSTLESHQCFKRHMLMLEWLLTHLLSPSLVSEATCDSNSLNLEWKDLQKMRHFKWMLINSSFLWCCLLCISLF